MGQPVSTETPKVTADSVAANVEPVQFDGARMGDRSMVKRLGTAPLFVALILSTPAFAGSNSWFGTWKLKLSHANQKPETLIYSDAGGGAMRMVSVEDQSEIVTHFDGQPALDTGRGATHQHALAITRTSPTSYTWTLFKEGKPWVTGKNVLASNKRSF